MFLFYGMEVQCLMDLYPLHIFESMREKKATALCRPPGLGEQQAVAWHGGMDDEGHSRASQVYNMILFRTSSRGTGNRKRGTH